MRGTIAGTLRRRPLPPTGMTVTTPRITTGTSTAVQASENAAVSETDIVEALISSPVGTVAGQQDFSQQVWDRAAVDGMGGGEFDTVLAADLGASLAASLEAQIVYGTGTAPELRGLVNAVGATSVTKTQASPTAATNFKAIGDLVRQAAEFYGTIEGLVIVMHPRRYAFIVSTLGYTPEWPAPVVVAGGLRTNLGAGTNQDEVYVLPADEVVLMTSAPTFTANVGQPPPQAVSTMTMRFVASMYAALLTSRVGPALVFSSGASTEWVAPTW